MKFSAAVAAAAIFAGAQAYSNVTYTTEVVTAYTTYCPGPTTITHGSSTYTVTSATTLTITDCPCTVTKPVIPTTVTKCTTCVAPTSVVVSSPAPYNNATVPVVTPVPTKPAPTSTPSGPVSMPPAFPGAANRATSGAGLAALVGLAAYIL